MGISVGAINAKQSLLDFKTAFTKVHREIGLVDGGLQHGALWCSRCVMVIKDNGWGYDNRIWSPKDVAEVLSIITLNKEYLDVEKWVYYSVIEFLRVCRNHKLSIEFTC